MTPTAQALHERVTGAVSYVVPKDDVPLAMRTPYVAPTGIQPGGEMTPTFLPREGESLIGRFGKNAAQGALGSIGWQLYNLARSVDFFAPTKSPPQAART